MRCVTYCDSVDLIDGLNMVLVGSVGTYWVNTYVYNIQYPGIKCINRIDSQARKVLGLEDLGCPDFSLSI